MKLKCTLIPLSLVLALALSGCGSSSDGSKPATAQTAPPEPMKATVLLEQIESRILNLNKQFKCESQIKEIPKGVELKEYEFTFSCPNTYVDSFDSIVTEVNAISKLAADNLKTSGANLSQVNAITAYDVGLKIEAQRLISFRAEFLSALDKIVATNAAALAQVKCTSTTFPTEIVIQCDPPSSMAEATAQEAALEAANKRMSNHPFREGSSAYSYGSNRANFAALPTKYSSYSRELASKGSDANSRAATFRWELLNKLAEELNSRLKAAYGIELSQKTFEFIRKDLSRSFFRTELSIAYETAKKIESILDSSEADLYFKGKGIKILEFTDSWVSTFFIPETGIFRIYIRGSSDGMNRSFEELLVLSSLESVALLKSAIQQTEESEIVAIAFRVQCRTAAERCLRVLKVFLDNKTLLKKNISVKNFNINASNKSLTVTERTSFPTLFFTGTESEEEILEFFKKHYTASPPIYRF